MTMCIKESLRLYPPAIYTMRKMVKDVTLPNKAVVKKGWQIPSFLYVLSCLIFIQLMNDVDCWYLLLFLLFKCCYCWMLMMTSNVPHFLQVLLYQYSSLDYIITQIYGQTRENITQKDSHQKTSRRDTPMLSCHSLLDQGMVCHDPPPSFTCPEMGHTSKILWDS